MWMNYTNWVCHGETLLDNTVRYQADIPSVEIDDQYPHVSSIGMLSELQEADDFDPSAEEHGPNSRARDFYRLLEDAERPLYDGCQKVSKLSFLLKLLHIKTMNQMTGRCMDMLLDLI